MNDFKLKVLIVDDENNIRKTLSYGLSNLGHDVISVANFDDAVEEAHRNTFNLAFVDLRLGETSGMDLIPALLADSPWMKIVVITAYASLETAVEAIRQGAFDYIAKPFSLDRIKLIAGQTSKICRLEYENATLKTDIDNTRPDLNWESKNPVMLRMLETAKTAAASDAIILLLGESGTGKSVLARIIHTWSRRAPGPFGIISCPSVPSELLESELFGHVRGSFTGAVKDNPGRIAACEGGTLFFDEIGEMAMGTQPKLLRFIQDKEYERLGESNTRAADVRILAATNADLSQLVNRGLFREDLYYRLNVISILLPPLRERKEDILPMAESFLRHFNRINHKSILYFSEEARRALADYSWPGNIRELRNTIERAVILGNRERVEKEDLPAIMNLEQKDEIALGKPVTLAKIEETHIRRVLTRSLSLQEAAGILGIDQATLWRKRKSYGL